MLTSLVTCYECETSGCFSRLLRELFLLLNTCINSYLNFLVTLVKTSNKILPYFSIIINYLISFNQKTPNL